MGEGCPGGFIHAQAHTRISSSSSSFSLSLSLWEGMNARTLHTSAVLRIPTYLLPTICIIRLGGRERGVGRPIKVDV